MYGKEPQTGAGLDPEDLTTEQRRALRESVDRIAAETRSYLPEEFTVGGEVTDSATGVQATVAVRPPVGNPVSAGFAPGLDDDDEELVSADDRAEVARGLAASAAFQVKQAIGDGFRPTAR